MDSERQIVSPMCIINKFRRMGSLPFLYAFGPTKSSKRVKSTLHFGLGKRSIPNYNSEAFTQSSYKMIKPSDISLQCFSSSSRSNPFNLCKQLSNNNKACADRRKLVSEDSINSTKDSERAKIPEISSKEGSNIHSKVNSKLNSKDSKKFLNKIKNKKKPTKKRISMSIEKKWLKDNNSAPKAVPIFAKLLDNLMNSRAITIKDLKNAKKEIFRTQHDQHNTRYTSYDIFVLALDNKFFSQDFRHKGSFTNCKTEKEVLRMLEKFLENPERLKRTKKRKNEEYRKKIFKAFLSYLHEDLSKECLEVPKKSRTKFIYQKYHRKLILELIEKYNGDLHQFAESQNVNLENMSLTEDDLRTVSKRYDFIIPSHDLPLETAFLKIFFTYNSGREYLEGGRKMINGQRLPLCHIYECGTLNIYTPKRITAILWENFLSCELFRKNYKKFLNSPSQEVNNESFYIMLNRKTVEEVIEYLEGKKVVFSWSIEELNLAKLVELNSLEKFEEKRNSNENYRYDKKLD